MSVEKETKADDIADVTNLDEEEYDDYSYLDDYACENGCCACCGCSCDDFTDDDSDEFEE